MYRQVFTAANLIILKYMYHPSIKIFQYFQKSKFSDIKYCIFKKTDCLHSILLNKIKLYIRTFKA